MGGRALPYPTKARSRQLRATGQLWDSRGRVTGTFDGAIRGLPKKSRVCQHIATRTTLVLDWALFRAAPSFHLCSDARNQLQGI